MSKQSNQRYRKEVEKQNTASNSYKAETSSCYDRQSNRYEYDTEDFHISNTKDTKEN